MNTEVEKLVPSFVAASDGQQVGFYDHGGQGPKVIMCHATGFCGPVWSPLADALAGSFHCYSLDFRAHGASAVPPETDLAWTNIVLDLQAVLSEIRSGDEPLLAIGHSLGGGILVMAEDAQPGTFEKIWSFEPILFPVASPDAELTDPPIAQGARRRRSTFDSRTEARERWSAKPPLDVLDDRALDAYVEHGLIDSGDGTVHLACRPNDESAVFMAHGTGALEMSRNLGLVMTVAVGAGDDPPAVYSRAAADGNDRIVLAEYPDLTHFGPLEAPDQLAPDIKAFFTGS